MAHEFLSDAWFAAVEALRTELDPPLPVAFRSGSLDIQVTDAPDGTRELHLRDGRLVPGRAVRAATRVVVAYAAARALLVDRDAGKLLEAYVSGQIRVEGDPSLLLQLQTAGPVSPRLRQLYRGIRDLTR